MQALITTKLEEPKKMSKQGDIYWNEISSHQYHFDREHNEVEEIKKLTKVDLNEFFKVFCHSFLEIYFRFLKNYFFT